MRVLQGLFLGLMYPSIIGLTIDYFPVYRSTTAVGIISIGSQAGIAMNFEMVALISSLGWRFSFEAVGIFFIAVGLA
jgi:MFS family permease